MVLRGEDARGKAARGNFCEHLSAGMTHVLYMCMHMCMCMCMHMYHSLKRDARV